MFPGGYKPANYEGWTGPFYPRDARSELAFELRASRLRVLDRVVQYCGHHDVDVIDAALDGERAGHREGVVDVGAPLPALHAFAPLVAVLEGGELQGGQDIAGVFHAGKIFQTATGEKK